MPPFIPRKRTSASPPSSSLPTPAKRTKITEVQHAEARSVPELQRTKTFSVGGSDDSDSSLSDVDSEQFENVPASTTQRAQAQELDEDEDIEWEDAAGHEHHKDLPEYKPQSDGPIEITLRKKDDDEGENWLEQAAANMKKAPSKRDKQVRICSHQLHVQFLLWHNAVRNKWISDRQVQQILVQQLPLQIKKEVEKWKRASGLALPDDSGSKTIGAKSKKKGKERAADPRRERDWGRPSERLEKGKPDMSNGDPLISLMKVLAAYWKKRFSIIAPGLRKRGYGTTRERKQIIQSQKNDNHDPEQHGERVQNIEELRQLARKCEGSRDVGAQLFTALLRGLGIEARLVASLQPSGYGWTKAEQMVPKNAVQVVNIDASSDDSESEDGESISEIARSRSRDRGRRGAARAKGDSGPHDDDDESIIDVTPSKPRKQPQRYDRDHPFPIYWTEAISPLTNKVLPVSPLVLATPVATTPEFLSTFEPRGVKAEKTKTIMAYVIAYSSDGTAKDVTVRYLKRHIWPGKTKGFRYPVEKIPVYNRHGKIKRYEEYDWFKRIMSFYVRPDLLRTAADDIEDATDLLPQQAEQKSTNQDVDTLQSLKSSADFVLERFLRREEALRPGSQPVRTFTSGKGDNLKHEPVYRRADVERCLTAESWHKEGRRPKAGEAPLKLVPVRAVTITRKREAEEHERVTGEKQMQGLYSWDQTEYIIPPPIVNGIIPKNAYGNIDCFVPSMVPRGAVHIPWRGTVRICKKLEVDFAEAVTGFEFGNKRAVPVCTGVVVAKEHEKAVREAWLEYNEAQRLKEEKKLEAMVLETWRKFVIGLRIRERVRDTYGEGAIDELLVGRSREQPIMLESEDEMGEKETHGAVDDGFAEGGGFLPESDDEHPGSDLEVGYHPNDDRQTDQPDTNPRSTAKGKQREEETYPTPSSVSPLKPAVRRQRPGKSIFGEPDSGEEDTEISELSSAPSSPLGVGDDDESEVDATDEDQGPDEDAESDDYHPTKRRSKSTTGTKDTAEARPSTRTRTPQTRQSTSISKANPTPRPSRSQRLSKANPHTTRTRGSASPPHATLAADVEGDNEADEEEDPVTARSRPRAKSKTKSRPQAEHPEPTPTRRRLRKGSSVVTSPYFDG